MSLQHNIQAQRNQQYKHYPLFKKLIQNDPYLLHILLQKHGSQKTNRSAIVVQATNEANNAIFTPILPKFISSTIVVFVVTMLMHRKRSLVLTSTATRSLLFKYLPVWLGYIALPIYNMKKINNADNLINDFGQIEEDFWKIYTQHGESLNLKRKD